MKISTRWCLIGLLGCWSFSVLALSPDRAQIVFSLLDYVGRDYRLAVSQGAIRDTFEYREMQEFAQRLQILWDSLRGTVAPDLHHQIAESLHRLSFLIAHKAPVDHIATFTDTLKSIFLRHGLITAAPLRWPSLRIGAQVYQQWCSSCHGDDGTGDGPAGVALVPPPANLRDSVFQQMSSPLSIYHTTRLGIEGTAMRGFPELSEEELWAVAFFIKSFPYPTAELPSDPSFRDSILTNLQRISHSTDQQLVQWINQQFPHLTLPTEQLLGGIRRFQPPQTPQFFIHQALETLPTLQKYIQQGAFPEAQRRTLALYLTAIEPLEQFLQIESPMLGSTIEHQMLTLRTALSHADSAAALQYLKELESNLREAEALFTHTTFSFGFTFWMATAIVFREGLEALLIIVVILSILRRLEAVHLRRFIHAGWLAAVAVGGVLWLFADALVQWGVQERELFEGVGALLAVVILLYVGFWLHQTASATGWQKFLQHRLQTLVSQRNAIGLFVLAFIAVFREAVETVVFLSALNLDAAPETRAGITTGIATAAIILTITSWIIRSIARSIPFRQLFQWSSAVMLLLAVILIGKGIHALQEGGILPANPLPWNWNFPLLGIHATAESIGAQVGVLILSGILWYWSRSQQLKATA